MTISKGQSMVKTRRRTPSRLISGAAMAHLVPKWALHFVQSVVLYRGQSHRTIAWQFERQARRRPNQPFLLYRDRSYTYAEANALINRHAHAYRVTGVVKGDVVAMMIENRPEFLWHFFALLKLGAIAS